jgi:hypothetical protein
MINQVQIDRIARRRAWGARLMAGALLTTAVHDIGAMRGYANGGFSFASEVVWMTVILLFLLFAGGGLVRTAAMRAALYDESTIEHGRRSLAFGFWGALLACGVSWVLSREIPISGPEVARVVVTYSIAMVLLYFANLEMKALKE